MGLRELKAQLGELDTNCNSSSFLEGIKPFGHHDKTDAQLDEMGETIPFSSRGVGGAVWEQECQQETSFGRKTQRTILKEVQVEVLYRKLSEITCQNPEVFHLDNFQFRDGELYYKNKSMSLTTGGER